SLGPEFSSNPLASDAGLSLWDGPPPPSRTGRIPVCLIHQRGSGPMKILMRGIDLGKNLCSWAGLDETGAIVLRRRLKRESLLRFTARLEVCTVAMEACCAAHHLGPQIAEQGHRVRLMSLHRVRRRLVSERTALINQLRALLLERGITAPQGRRKLERLLSEILAAHRHHS